MQFQWDKRRQRLAALHPRRRIRTYRFQGMMTQHRIHNTKLPKQINIKENPQTQKNK